jgi:hypothetical protein
VAPAVASPVPRARPFCRRFAVVTLGQKEIAGLAELNEISEKLRAIRYLTARRDLAISYLIGNVDEASAFDLLDFMEEVSIYQEKKYVKDRFARHVKFPRIYLLVVFQSTPDPAISRHDGGSSRFEWN